jgi:hypothetical protein
VTVTANGSSGYRFIHWGGSAASGWSLSQRQQNPVILTMDGDKALSASFDGITISVTSPNGGESWQVGSTQTIAWTMSGDTSNISYFKLAFSTDGGNTWQDVTPSAIAASARSYNWAIPNTPPSQGRVRVRALDAETWILEVDTSGSNITVGTVPAAPQITGVDPAEPQAQPTRQWLSIMGSGFALGAQLILSIGESQYPIPPDRTEYVHAGQIRLFVGLTDPGTWSVQLTNPNAMRSNPFNLSVRAGTAPTGWGIDAGLVSLIESQALAYYNPAWNVSLSQFKAWDSLVAQGIFLTGSGSNPAGSFLYVISGAHLVHLAGGILMLVLFAI